MSESPKFHERVPGILRALAVGVLAGYLFDYLETPIPWMIGPMIAIAMLKDRKSVV